MSLKGEKKMERVVLMELKGQTERVVPLMGVVALAKVLGLEVPLVLRGMVELLLLATSSRVGESRFLIRRRRTSYHFFSAW